MNVKEETLNAFTLTKLLATREHLGDLYHEFLRVPSMCAGVCQLTAGATDPQEQHTEDELYYIVQGKALLKVGNEDIPVEPGSLVFVAAHIEHRFHTITEDLTAHVFFAPAECSLDTREKEASISDPQFRRERSVTWQDPRVAAEASQPSIIIATLAWYMEA
jgi:mannose-6-phosphate isomerase-like protein (cupin superfamily)